MHTLYCLLRVPLFVIVAHVLCWMSQTMTAASAAMAVVDADQCVRAVRGKTLVTSASAPALITAVATPEKEGKESTVPGDVHIDWPAYKWPRVAKDFFYRKRSGFTQVQEYAVNGYYWLLQELLERARTLEVAESVLKDPVTVLGKYYTCNVLHVAATKNHYSMVKDILAFAEKENLLAKVLFQPHVPRPSDMVFYPDVDNKNSAWTELHEAAELGNVYIVELLLKTAQNNRIAVPNIEGAVTIAWSKRRLATLQVFERYGYVFRCSSCEKLASECCCNYGVVRDREVTCETSWLDDVASLIVRALNGCGNPNSWDDDEDDDDEALKEPDDMSCDDGDDRSDYDDDDNYEALAWD